MTYRHPLLLEAGPVAGLPLGPAIAAALGTKRDKAAFERLRQFGLTELETDILEIVNADDLTPREKGSRIADRIKAEDARDEARKRILQATKPGELPDSVDETPVTMGQEAREAETADLCRRMDRLLENMGGRPGWTPPKDRAEFAERILI